MRVPAPAANINVLNAMSLAFHVLPEKPVGILLLLQKRTYGCESIYGIVSLQQMSKTRMAGFCLVEHQTRGRAVGKKKKEEAQQESSSPLVQVAYIGPAHIRPREKGSLIGLWISLLCIVLVVVAIYIGFAVFFRYHFTFNTYINGINCTFMTPAQVEERIAVQVQSYKLEIHTRDNKVEFIDAASVELTYVPDGQVQRLLDDQNIFTWPNFLIVRAEPYITKPSARLIDVKLNAAVKQLRFMDPRQMKPPVDAYPVFGASGYRAHPEELGTTIDELAACKVIREAMLSLADVLDLNETDSYVKPKVVSDSPELMRDIELYNQYVPFSITYTLGDTTVVLDGTTAINWVTVGVTEPGMLDRDKVVEWVNAFADKYDTYGTTRTIINGFGEEKTVTGGIYGWLMDRDAEVEAILWACMNHSVEAREPCYTQTAASHNNPDWGTTYAEVDISRQHMWYYVDGKVVLECDVVTGLPDGYNNTPEGVYSIYDMRSPTILIGRIMPDTGEPEYRSPVSYWMAATYNGVGFHDATWQPWFGGDRWLYGGSHGCINMPYYDAQYLYSLIEIGCPAVFHY